MVKGMTSYEQLGALYTDRHDPPALRAVLPEDARARNIPARAHLAPYESSQVVNPTRHAPFMVRERDNVHTYPALPHKPHARAHPHDFPPPPDHLDSVPHVVDARDILDLSDQNVPLHDIEHVVGPDGRVTFYKYNRNFGTYTRYGTSRPPGEKIPVSDHAHSVHRSNYFGPPRVRGPVLGAAPGHQPDPGVGYVPDLTPLVYV